MCLGDWKTHGSGTGGFYQCNIYTGGGEGGGGGGEEGGSKNESAGVRAVKDEERKRMAKREEMRRYEHHYMRYKQHQDGVRHNHALVTEVAARATELAVAIDEVGGGVSGDAHVAFLEQAAALVGTARRVLMWSYAEAFFLPQSGNEWRKSVCLIIVRFSSVTSSSVHSLGCSSSGSSESPSVAARILSIRSLSSRIVVTLSDANVCCVWASYSPHFFSIDPSIHPERSPGGAAGHPGQHGEPRAEGAARLVQRRKQQQQEEPAVLLEQPSH